MIQFLLDTDRELFNGALAFAQKQVKRLLETAPARSPMYTADGIWKTEDMAWSHWCDGFLPVMMWMFYKQLGPKRPEARFWWEQALQYSRRLELPLSEPNPHDLGFIFMTTHYRWNQCSHDPSIKETMVRAGQMLASQFDEHLQALRSPVAESSLFIDLMMNVGVIFYAGRETGDRNLRDIATRHCLTTRKFLVRGDGSTAQEGVFDEQTGGFLRNGTEQGFRSDSCWSRGLAWAIYGFNTAYEYSRDPRFMQTAQACADYYIVHTPPNGIPPWDYHAPAESRSILDTSAAAIAAAALLRLCRQVSDPIKGHFYWSTAIHILRSLCVKYLAQSDENWQGILTGAVYHMNKGLGVDESVMWGDYYFVEALEEAVRVMGHGPGPQGWSETPAVVH